VLSKQRMLTDKSLGCFVDDYNCGWIRDWAEEGKFCRARYSCLTIFWDAVYINFLVDESEIKPRKACVVKRVS
jgi:hypothetical protein